MRSLIRYSICLAIAFVAPTSAGAQQTADRAVPRTTVTDRLPGLVDNDAEIPVVFPSTAVAAGPVSVVTGASDAVRYALRHDSFSQRRVVSSLFGGEPAEGALAARFDRLTGRALLAGATRSGDRTSIHLAVHQRNEIQPLPNDLNQGNAWCARTTRLDVRVADPQLRVGVGDRWVALTVRPAGDGAAFLVVYDKVDLLDSSATGCKPLAATVFRIDPAERGIAPAAHLTRSSATDPPLYLLSSIVDGVDESEYVLWALRGQSEPRLERQSVRVWERYSAPPPLSQKGGAEIAAGDGGIAAAVVRDDVLWAVHTVDCGTGGGQRACVRLVELEVEPAARRRAAPVVRTLEHSSNWSTALPGVAVNKNRDVAVTFVRTRANRFIASAVALLGRDRTDFGPTRVLEKGKCALDEGFAGAPSMGVQADPTDDLGFWVSAPAAVSKRGCSWSTTTMRFRRKDRATPPMTRLAQGTFAVPSFGGQGRLAVFEATGTVPAEIGSTRGRRLVVRLRDASRPRVTCSSQTPFSGCATLDYPTDSNPVPSLVAVETSAGPRDYFLSDNQLLTTVDIRQPG